MFPYLLIAALETIICELALPNIWTEWYILFGRFGWKTIGQHFFHTCSMGSSNLNDMLYLQFIAIIISKQPFISKKSAKMLSFLFWLLGNTFFFFIQFRLFQPFELIGGRQFMCEWILPRRNGRIDGWMFKWREPEGVIYCYDIRHDGMAQFLWRVRAWCWPPSFSRRSIKRHASIAEGRTQFARSSICGII